MATRFDFDRVKKNIERMKKTLPVLLANQAQNFFTDSWKKQGWDDNGVKRWPKRKSNGKKSIGRATLVKSGKLRRAVGQSIRLKSFDKIKLVVALPYAAVHNDGYNGVVRAHTRARFTKSTTSQFIGLRQNKNGKMVMATRRTTIYTQTGEVKVKAYNMNMPQRKFMGDSTTLRRLQKDLINKEVSKIWQV